MSLLLDVILGGLLVIGTLAVIYVLAVIAAVLAGEK